MLPRPRTRLLVDKNEWGWPRMRIWRKLWRSGSSSNAHAGTTSVGWIFRMLQPSSPIIWEFYSFEISDGLCNRHGMRNQATHRETGSASTEKIEPFRKLLDELIKKGLLTSHLYSGDETGLYWRSMHKNTQAFKNEDSTPGRKMSKERFSFPTQTQIPTNISFPPCFTSATSRSWFINHE